MPERVCFISYTTNLADGPAIFRELGFCEQVLESDLPEWMRLMVEAEWFG